MKHIIFIVEEVSREKKNIKTKCQAEEDRFLKLSGTVVESRKYLNEWSKTKHKDFNWNEWTDYIKAMK